jgi:anthranilate/para-aminobenzoate synthase component II
MRLLLLDNFDSFTFTLADYLRQQGAEVVVRRNDATLTELQALEFDGIVLSPGPGTPAQAGVMPAVIEAYHQHVPMLGVWPGTPGAGRVFWRKSGASRPAHARQSGRDAVRRLRTLFRGPARHTAGHAVSFAYCPRTLAATAPPAGPYHRPGP